MKWERLFIVAEGTLNLTVDQINSWLINLAGRGILRFRLTDMDLSRVRNGGTVTRTVIVPVSELSSTFRNFLLSGKNAVSVGLHIAPWFVQSGTKTVTDESGNQIEIPVFDRKGTHIDLLFRDNEVDVRSLEGALMNTLPEDYVLRSDGSVAPAVVSPINLKLVPASVVKTPTRIYPSYEPPEVITDPDLLSLP